MFVYVGSSARQTPRRDKTETRETPEPSFPESPLSPSVRGGASRRHNVDLKSKYLPATKLRSTSTRHQQTPLACSLAGATESQDGPLPGLRYIYPSAILTPEVKATSLPSEMAANSLVVDSIFFFLLGVSCFPLSSPWLLFKRTPRYYV